MWLIPIVSDIPAPMYQQRGDAPPPLLEAVFWLAFVLLAGALLAWLICTICEWTWRASDERTDTSLRGVLRDQLAVLKRLHW